MSKPVQLIVYTLEKCPHCVMLKNSLKKGGYTFSERDLSTAEALTELRVNGVFVNEAPVLQRGDDFYTTQTFSRQECWTTKNSVRYFRVNDGGTAGDPATDV